MNGRDDLFGELLPATYVDDEEARTLAWIHDEPIDYGFFSAGVWNHAWLARRAGLVVPGGKTRRVWRPGDATGDVFAENGSGVAK